MLRFLYFLFFPKLIVIFCLSDVRLALFGCYRKEQTRGCREGKQFLKWDIKGAALQEPSILVKMIPRILHSTVKVNTPQCIYNRYIHILYRCIHPLQMMNVLVLCFILYTCDMVPNCGHGGSNRSQCLPTPGKHQHTSAGRMSRRRTATSTTATERRSWRRSTINYLQSIKSTSLSA